MKFGPRIGSSSVQKIGAVGLVLCALIVAFGVGFLIGTRSAAPPTTVTMTMPPSMIPTFLPTTIVSTETIVLTTTTVRSTTRTSVITTTETTIPSIKAQANIASIAWISNDTDWHICHKYPINVTIEFKWKIAEWRDAGFELGHVGGLKVEAKIKLMGEGVPLTIKEEGFFVEIFNTEMGPLLNLYGRSFEPKEVEAYFVNEVTLDFEFHPEEGITPSGFEYRPGCELEIHGEIDGRPVEIEVPLVAWFPWSISIKP